MSCNANELPEHPASISALRIELFEVTVGRFRSFVAAYPGSKPAAGAGKNPHVAADTGWQPAWDGSLPQDKAALIDKLKCSQYQSWTDAAGDTDNRPINCVSWLLAFSFCAWDGGRLPTEAEWELVAAGGDSNRLFPWGSAPIDDAHAVWNCCGSGSCGTCQASDIVAVGSRAAGIGRYGQYDLAGSMYEWVFDWHLDGWYSPGPANPCSDCANTTVSQYRGSRGGSWMGSAPADFRAAHRYRFSPTDGHSTIGFRCARLVP